MAPNYLILQMSVPAFHSIFICHFFGLAKRWQTFRNWVELVKGGTIIFRSAILVLALGSSPTFNEAPFGLLLSEWKCKNVFPKMEDISSNDFRNLLHSYAASKLSASQSQS